MRCWAEININNLYSNIDEIEKIVPKEKIIAVQDFAQHILAKLDR